MDIMKIPPEMLGKDSSNQVEILPTAEDVANDFAEMARKNLEAIPDSQAKQSLIFLADHVTAREY